MSVWDLYLDVDDARAILAAAATVEEHRAVREPLPLDDPRRLLERLRTIATLFEQDALHWADEAADRREEAAVDGGRWGDVATAARMAAIAEGTVTSALEVADAAAAAAVDLGARLATAEGRTPAPPAGAADALLRELGLTRDADPSGDPDGDAADG